MPNDCSARLKTFELLPFYRWSTLPSQVNAYYFQTKNKIGKITLFCFVLSFADCVVNLYFLLLAFELKSLRYGRLQS